MKSVVAVGADFGELLLERQTAEEEAIASRLLYGFLQIIQKKSLFRTRLL